MISPKDAFRKVNYHWFSGIIPGLAIYPSRNSIKWWRNFLLKHLKICHSINKSKISSSLLISEEIIISISKSLRKYLEIVTPLVSSWAQPLHHQIRSSPSPKMTNNQTYQQERSRFLGSDILKHISSLCS